MIRCGGGDGYFFYCLFTSRKPLKNDEMVSCFTDKNISCRHDMTPFYCEGAGGGKTGNGKFGSIRTYATADSWKKNICSFRNSTWMLLILIMI